MVFSTNFQKKPTLRLVAKRNGRACGFGCARAGGHFATGSPKTHGCVVCFALSFRHTVGPLAFCSCTDGLCSFIHKGYTNFDLALHLQHVSDWDGGRVGGRERAPRWKRSGRLSHWPDTITAPCASLQWFSVPWSPVCFLLCMSVITRRVKLLATDREHTSPHLFDTEKEKPQRSMESASFLQ